MKPHIAIAAEKVAEIFAFPVTNSVIMTWLVTAFMIFIGFWSVRHLQTVPRGIQNFLEMLVEGLTGLLQSITGEKTHEFFPLLATFFFFIIVANWSGLLPGVGSIGLYKTVHGEQEFIPLFRGPTADLNTTLALAIVAVVALQYYGIKTLGSKYLTRYINIKNPILFFVGVLEIVSEFARIISFAFRLFGNIFAGEVLLTIVAFIMPYFLFFAPLPFFGLELFVGFIQAFIFTTLTAVFLRVATVAEEH